MDKLKMWMVIMSIMIIYLATPAHSTLGIDMSSATCSSASLSDFQCLVKAGYTFAVIEVWDGGYGYNSDAANCISWAKQAGMKWVDVYAFICSNCGSNNNPASNAINTINSNLKGQFKNFWFDVEQCSGCWQSNVCSYLEEAASAASSAGLSFGFYSSEYEWSSTAGSSCTSFSKYPLWYAHYDGVANFSDPSAYQFGGWTQPTMKQYADSGPCANVDVDYYPGANPPTTASSSSSAGSQASSSSSAGTRTSSSSAGSQSSSAGTRTSSSSAGSRSSSAPSQSSASHTSRTSSSSSESTTSSYAASTQGESTTSESSSAASSYSTTGSPSSVTSGSQSTTSESSDSSSQLSTTGSPSSVTSGTTSESSSAAASSAASSAAASSAAASSEEPTGSSGSPSTTAATTFEEDRQQESFYNLLNRQRYHYNK